MQFLYRSLPQLPPKLQRRNWRINVKSAKRDAIKGNFSKYIGLQFSLKRLPKLHFVRTMQLVQRGQLSDKIASKIADTFRAMLFCWFKWTISWLQRKNCAAVGKVGQTFLCTVHGISISQIRKTICTFYNTIYSLTTGKTWIRTRNIRVVKCVW